VERCFAAGCSSAPTTPVSPPTPIPVTTPHQLPFAHYREFWRVVDSARAAPRSQDWTPKIKELATGQALRSALTDVANFASLPAHVVGTVTRDPSVAGVTPAKISILDCVDLGTAHLVSDRNGDLLDDTKNRVKRFHLRAELVPSPDGRWLVSTTAPALKTMLRRAVAVPCFGWCASATLGDRPDPVTVT
jgi:hypothetical protein